MNKSTTSKAVLDTVEQTQQVSRKPKKRLYFGLAIVLIVAVIAIVLGFHAAHNKTQENNSAFQINHTYYSKTYVSQMVNFALQDQSKTATEAEKNRVAKNIFNLYETEIAAKSSGITPNNAELQSAKAQITLPRATNSAAQTYINLAVFNAALPRSYNRYMTGDDQGYVFIFDFSQKVVPPPVQETPTKGYGNQALIAQDRSYADQQAKKYYSELKNNQISAVNLLSAINANPRINFGDASASIDSSRGAISGQILYTDAYNYVAKQSKPILSNIQVGKVQTKINGGPGDYADGYYYFVQLTKASPIIGNPAATVANQMNKLGAVYYGI